MTPNTELVEEIFRSATGKKLRGAEPIGGGDAGYSMRLSSNDGQRYYLKVYSANSQQAYTESKMLELLSKSQACCVPQVFYAKDKYLLLEWIDQTPPPPDLSALGKSLAYLHCCIGESFGLDFDNHIGLSPQKNIPLDVQGHGELRWSTFYFQHRMQYQVNLMQSGKEKDDMLEFLSRYKTAIIDCLNENPEKPRLIHGDLWSGNWFYAESGRPYFIDPACYFAHREAEFGMIELFGGVNQSFYSAYNQVLPLGRNWRQRNSLYRFYHLLNHYNIFGVSYLPQLNACQGDIIRNLAIT